MFDLGWSELLLVAAVALIVIGPKDLPQAIRTVTQVIRKLRGMAREFQSGLDDLAREAGVDDIKRDLTDFPEEYDPGAALESIADADREVASTFDDIEGGASTNQIHAPGLSRPPDFTPPDLTPADFGAEELVGQDTGEPQNSGKADGGDTVNDVAEGGATEGDAKDDQKPGGKA